MKHSIKQILLTVLMALVSISASAYDFEVDGIRYDITSFTELTVAASSLSDDASGMLSIPSSVTFNGKELKVTEIKENFAQNNTQITELTVNANVTSIGANAFTGCTSLSKIKLPTSVATLCESSFSGCMSLNSIDAQGLTEIGENTFLGCSSIVSISLPKLTSIGASSFENCTAITTVDFPKLVTIGKCSFKGCTAINDVNLPEAVTSIGESAFEECSSLTSFVIPNSVKEMGGYVLRNCNQLKSVSIGIGLSTLISPFVGCDSLSYIRFEDSSETLVLASSYFSGTERVEYGKSCSSMFADLNIKEAYIGRNLSTRGSLKYEGNNQHYFLPNPAFADSKVSKITLGPLVSQLPTRGNASLGCYIFEDRTRDVMASLVDTTANAFINCTNLIEIDIESPISSIGKNTFEGCTSLEKIVLPNKVVDIGSSAFYGCRKLSSIELGSRISNIGSNAFAGCDSISEIKIRANTPPAYGSEFSSNNYINTLLYVPTGYLDAYKNANPWKNFWGLQESNDLISMFEVDSVIYEITADKDVTIIGKTFTSNKDLVLKNIVSYKNVDYNVSSISDNAFENCDLLESLSVRGISIIGTNAFTDCKKLQTVLLSENVTIVGANCFSGCTSLQSVDISSVNSLGDGCFNGCRGLTSVNLPNGLTSMGEGTFADCSSLEQISLPSSLKELPNSCFSGCTSLQSVDMSSVNSIGDGCFNGCRGLTSVNLPNGLTSMGEGTFTGCSSLEQISLPSSLKELPNSCFSGCTSLQSVYLNEVQLIGGNCFYNCDSLKRISLPTTLTILGTSVFAGCSNLKELRIEDSSNALEIPAGPYYGTTDVQEKTVNGKSIRFQIVYYNGYFAGMSIEKLYVGRSLSAKSRHTLTGGSGVDPYIITTYDEPFNSLPNLKELTIGADVAALGAETDYISEVDLACSAGSFNKCDSIKSVTVYCQNPPTGAAFTDNVYAKAEINIPENSRSLYEAAEGWKDFFNREENGITDLQIEETNGTLHIYDLQGRKLSVPQKGINIINGKKVLVK